MNGNFPSTTIGWMAIATGTAVVLAVVTITLFYTVNSIFGSINDAINGVAAILSAILAWMLYVQHHAKSPILGQVTLGLAVIGAAIMVVGSILILFNFTGWVLAGLYTGVGSALIGIWLIGFNYSMLNDGILPNNLVKFGLVTGAFMVFGLFALPGIFAGIDSLESVPWYLIAVLPSGLGIYITYPIWCIWLGRVMLRTQ
ncbi:MAG TPA: hypothetical protein VK851_15300 [Anaerolineales bacterium]|nr:hypothetical protein [Anaerolineales bacterium]